MGSREQRAESRDWERETVKKTLLSFLEEFSDIIDAPESGFHFKQGKLKFFIFYFLKRKKKTAFQALLLAMRASMCFLKQKGRASINK